MPNIRRTHDEVLKLLGEPDERNIPNIKYNAVRSAGRKGGQSHVTNAEIYDEFGEAEVNRLISEGDEGQGGLQDFRKPTPGTTKFSQELNSDPANNEFSRPYIAEMVADVQRRWTSDRTGSEVGFDQDQFSYLIDEIGPEELFSLPAKDVMALLLRDTTPEEDAFYNAMRPEDRAHLVEEIVNSDGLGSISSFMPEGNAAKHDSRTYSQQLSPQDEVLDQMLIGEQDELQRSR